MVEKATMNMADTMAIFLKMTLFILLSD
jgi:hypothetical protein